MRHDGGVKNTHQTKREETEMKITTIGLDLAKNVFHAVCCNQQGKVIKKKMLKRRELIHYFSQIEPCLIGMEACASAYFWARELEALGHNVKLIPAQHVKAFLRGNKNDYNDALAISEAVVRPEMRFVAIKTIEQQDMQALHRIRSLCIKERTALSNQLRALLAEYGIVFPRGIATLRRHIIRLQEDEQSPLTDFFKQSLFRGYEQLQQLEDHISAYSKTLEQHVQQSEACQHLKTLPGFGPIVASAFYIEVGNGAAYRRGRDVSASLGVVPRQHSTGGKDKLLGISKRGNGYLRSLLVHGARSVVNQAKRKEDNLSQWINHIRLTRGYNKATVALANKMARMGWAVLKNNTVYQENFSYS